MSARFLVAAMLVSAAAASKVAVEIFVESYCPCSGTFHAQYQDAIMPLVDSIAVLNRSWDGHVDGDKVRCFHGDMECEANKLQACASHYSSSYKQWLNYTVCINGPCANVGCKDEFVVGHEVALPVEEKCARSVGLPWEKVHECFTSSLGDSLIMQDAVYDAKVGEVYGLQGLPVVRVNGVLFSKPADCKSFDADYHTRLIKAICDAYTGNDKPAACSK